MQVVGIAVVVAAAEAVVIVRREARASQEPKSTKAFRAYTAEGDMAGSDKAVAFWDNDDDDDDNNDFDTATSSCLLAFGGC